MLVELAVAGREKLTKMIQDYKCIQPFDYALLDGDGYVLTVRDETTLHYLEHRNVVSYEVVFTPATGGGSSTPAFLHAIECGCREWAGDGELGRGERGRYVQPLLSGRVHSNK